LTFTVVAVAAAVAGRLIASPARATAVAARALRVTRWRIVALLFRVYVRCPDGCIGVLSVLTAP
jgi:hypothetical protein